MRSVFILIFLALYAALSSQTMRTADASTLNPVSCATLDPQDAYDLCAGSPDTIKPVIHVPDNAPVVAQWATPPASISSPQPNSLNLIVSTGGVYTLTASNPTSNCSTVMTYTVLDCVGIRENTFNAVVSIYPNPCRDRLILQTSEALEFLMIDASGRIVRKGKVQENRTVMDVSDIPRGFYFLMLSNSKGCKPIKVLKE